MKVFERVLEQRIRCQVSIDNMQFSFMFGKVTHCCHFHHATSTRKNTKQRGISGTVPYMTITRLLCHIQNTF